MKLKTKLKSFYRHNKDCGGMWSSLVVIIGIATPPYGIATISYIAIFAIMICFWVQERRADTYKRILNVSFHKHTRYIDESHNRFLELVRLVCKCKAKADNLETVIAELKRNNK